MPKTKLKRDFQCVTGWRVPDVHWTGVRLSDLLDRAGVKPEATALRFVSFDGEYTESLTLAQARRPDVMVAYELDGKPALVGSRRSGRGSTSRRCTATSRASGSSRIELTAEVEPGYWEEQRLRRRRLGRSQQRSRRRADLT